ncbi:MAG: tripartite tricarboxylate transporter TctB family protein [Pseudomonadota bacterium]
MILADRLIAVGIMILSGYFMWHATVLPIGWRGETGGPGGGAFPFWLSAAMMAAAAGVLLRSFRAGFATASDAPFFDPETVKAVAAIAVALTIAVALMPLVGAYVALPLYIFWHLKIFGRRGWLVTLCLVFATPVFMFFFFEVTLKILLPKGVTEPLFLPLYAAFF